MKKSLYLIVAAAIALVACAKEEAYEPEVMVTPEGRKITIGASFELPLSNTKSDYDAAGNFTWSDDDAIWIGTNATSGENNWGSGTIMTAEAEVGPGYKRAKFDCTIPGEYTAIAAVFPKTVQPSYSNGTLSLTLPETIAWTDTQLADPANATMQVDNIMVARYVDIYEYGYPHDTYTGLEFYNVGGLFCLTLKNIPVDAQKLVFTTDKKINGTFAVSNVVSQADSKNYPQIATTTTETDAEKSVTIEFTTITNGENKMTFFIPVPVGSYVIGFDVQKEDGTSVWKFSASKANDVERGHIVKMPTLSHVIVGGDGDGATNIITTPTAFSGNVPLPSTENNIYVRMNETDGTITLSYSSAEGALHPANVYIQALGNVNTLNINLPDSHVELTGEDEITHVITNVSSYTSYSTLKVDGKVQIGKSGEQNSGLTITGGSLDLAAEVVGPVTVDIPADNNNETEEKVTINITSPIKDLVVTRAADSETPADKVYVTLGTGASVEAAITVPEVNCNLYIAPGVSATTVTTSAAENTIEGTVTGILTAQPKPGQQQEQQEETSTVNVTVTGTVANLAATGGGTTVTVTEEATVSTSITAYADATVIVANAAVEDITGDLTEIGGDIQTVAELVAIIGSTPYSTLEEAFTAVKEGETIVLQKNVTQDAGLLYDKENVSAKLNLNNYTLTINTGSNVNNRAIKINNGTLEVYGGSIVAVGAGTNSNNGTGCYGAFRVEANGTLNAHDIALTNSRPWGLNVKVCGGVATLTNVNITSSYGGGIEVTEADLGTQSKKGEATLTNCNFTQTGYYDHCSTTLSVSGGSSLTINSGSYTSDNYALYVFSSGGVITVKDGTFSGNYNGTAIIAAIDTNTYPQYTGGLQIEGGNYTGGFAITSPAFMNITGGTFDHNPTAFVADGYQAVKSGNLWTVSKVAGVAAIGSQGYSTLAAAFEAAQNGNTITLLADCEVSEALVNTKNITLDLGTYSIIGNVNGKLLTNQGTLTINANSTNPGKIYNTDISAQGHDAVQNNEGATITINGGIFGDSDSDMTNDNLINRGAAIRNYGTATLNGGYYTDVNNFTPDGGVYAYSIINGGTMVINSGVTAYGKNHGNIATWGPLTVNGGNFSISGTRSYYNVYSAGDTANILGGTFTKQSGDALVTFCIDDADAVVNVSGGTFNNLNNNSVFKSGAGTVSVTGGTFNKQPEAAIIADGYAATQTGDVWTVEQKKVAQIGEVKYASLPAAIAAALGYDTVTLIDDVVLTEILVIAESKNITLDLGTYSISGNVAGYLLQNQGTLTINASSTNPGKIYNVSSAAKGHGAVLNEGAITINGGIFGDNDTDPTNTGTVNSGCALRNRGTATVNGGVFTTAEPDYPGSVWAYAIVSGESDTPASITFNGGHVYGKHGDICNNHGTLVINDVTTYGTAEYYSVYAWKNGTSTVKGGTFVKNSHPKASIGYQFCADESSANIIVEGGNFTNNTNANFGSGSGKVELKGGTYNKRPEAGIIAPGYHAVQNGNVWTVEEKCLTVGVGGQYETLAAAIAAANSGDIIKLVSDLSVSSATSLSKSFTLDLNGNTINSSSVLFNIYDSSVELTIKDSGENGGIDVSADKVIYISSGKVTLKSGAISAHSTSSYTYGISVGSSGNFVMDGGSITIPSTSTSNYNYCVGSYGNLTINGGYLEAHANGGNYAINTTGGSATINGGSVVAYAYPAGFKSPYVLYGSGAKAVYGGYFKAFGDSATYSAGYLVDGTATIYAGYFGGNYYYGVTNYVSEDSTLRELTTSETDPTHAAAKAAGYKFVVERSLEITGPGIEDSDDNE